MDKNQYLRAFGHAVADRRRLQGLSQEALGHATGLHRTYVGSVERGERNCSLTTILAIADGLDCLPEDLLSDVKHFAEQR